MPRLALLPVILLLASCGGPAGGPPTTKPPVPVEVATVAVADVPRNLAASGRILASATVTLRPQVTAEVRAVAFPEGAQVKAGDLLFDLDDRTYAAAEAVAEAGLAKARAAERQAQAVVARDTAAQALAEADVRRTATLEAQGAVAPQVAEQTRAAAAVAAATATASVAAAATAAAAVQSAAADLARAQVDRSRCRITAPIDGRTGPVGLTVGNLAVAGQTVLGSVVSAQPAEVEFTLPADDLPALRAAQAGEVPPTIRILPTDGGAPVVAALHLIDNQVDTATGTVRLRGRAANADGRLWPGQPCRVELRLGIETARVTVPARAVKAGQRGSLVWIVNADGTLAPRPVTVARHAGDVTVIGDGLTGGETIVTDGQLRCYPGAVAQVVVPGEPAAKRPAKPGTP